MSEFKRIKELGLKVEIARQCGPYVRDIERNMVSASDLEALLEKAVRVYGYKNRSKTSYVGFAEENNPAFDTHAGLLLIVKELDL